MEITEKHILGAADGESSGYFYKADAGDGLPVLQRDWKEKFQLIYLDPPFFTGQTFRYRQRIGEEGWRGNTGYRIPCPAYSDQWESRESFLHMLRQVLTCSRELLKPEG